MCLGRQYNDSPLLILCSVPSFLSCLCIKISSRQALGKKGHILTLERTPTKKELKGPKALKDEG